MKAFTFTSVLLFLSATIFAQAPSIEWEKTLGGTGGDYGYSIKQTNDGGYIVLGEISSPVGGMITNNHGDYDFWVVKLDNTGAIQWQKSLGGSSNDTGHSIQQTADGGYIIVGNTDSNNFDVTGHYGDTDVWVVKLSSTGVIEWQKALGGSSTDGGLSIQQTTDGGYILCGYTYSTNGAVTTGNGGWIVKLNSTGTIQWQKGVGNYMNCYMYCIQQTTDGGYIAAGYSNGPLGNSDYHIVKLDNLGTIQWEKYYGGTANDAAYYIQQTTDGGYIVAGETNSSNTDVTQNNGSIDYWVVKLDSDGILQWQKALGGSSHDLGKSVQQTTDGGYVVCGYTNSNDGLVTGNHGDNDYWVVKLDNSGSLLWQKTLGGSGEDQGESIQQTADGGYIIVGYTGSSNGDGDVTIQYGNRNFWVVKLSPDNLSTADFSNVNRVTFFPNPTKDFFKLSNYDNIQKIELYNLNGKKLLSKNDFVDEKISIQNFSKGMYFIKIYLDNGDIKSDKIIKE